MDEEGGGMEWSGVGGEMIGLLVVEGWCGGYGGRDSSKGEKYDK